ncbi:MAG TPA: hypothetical protein PLY52_00450 [Methanothrix sp.]|jgi:hypothetical protein|uniref:hypothetical protein n=1 Tax=Methanothrix sp. TaxID=90426 RepID=UPI002CFDDF56|nr:hypothetical protein [Methanothrix sp.]MDI9416404.1 hypothetical protein [Euryarchaeota archaeon]HON34765.1 hypothetical protein [Methanothrix sp.]HRU74622.1 hypothetical protein [Methanothrix sp.]
MKSTVSGLVIALAVLMAIASLTWAGEAQSSRGHPVTATTNSAIDSITNSTANSTANSTTNSTTNSTANSTANSTVNLSSNEAGDLSRGDKVLRAGGRSARSSMALGENSSSRKAGIEVGLERRAEFNLSQRQGSVSKFEFNSDIYTPLFRQNLYTRTKPSYLAPENLSTREVYNLTGYPVIMLPNSIPEGARSSGNLPGAKK